MPFPISTVQLRLRELATARTRALEAIAVVHRDLHVPDGDQPAIVRQLSAIRHELEAGPGQDRFVALDSALTTWLSNHPEE